MSVYKKLNEARIKLQNTSLKKSGYNKFAGYQYFELSDFLPAINNIFNEVGLCGVVSFGVEMATLTIVDTESGQELFVQSPMSSASLKGCHDVQNLGAVQTYLRRYLWVTALEIVEHDALELLTSNKDAEPQKTQIQDARLAKAIESIKAGKYTKEKLLADFDIKDYQLQIINEALNVGV